jgi:ubiquinone/menaquinone biosynthesis C-methylase UbiE
MSLVCPVDLDTARLRQEISAVYARVATGPDGEFHFHRGPDYAVTVLGYDRAELDQLPADVTARFAGIGNPHLVAPLPVGATVLDVGCGAGMDLLLAARQVGPTGRAIGVDMTEPMRACAIAGAAACGLANVDVRAGDATRLPVEDASIDVVISNGVLNLVPQKQLALAEIRRVLKPGGRAQIADIILHEGLSEVAIRDIDLWAG